MSEVALIPCLEDNYIYAFRAGDAVIIVDPGEASPVIDWATCQSCTPTHILLTHHHSDHSGGALALQKKYEAKLIGARADRHRLPKLDQEIAEGDEIVVGDARAKILALPGHTSGHIAYWFEAETMIFVGDVLFRLSCGRVFEGTHAQMWHSLDRLCHLPDDTRVYCGHEYTEDNVSFALSLEPNNAALQAFAKDVAALRANNQPTIPSTIGFERALNPFLRVDEPAFLQSVAKTGATPEDMFTYLRNLKDVYD